MPLVIRGSEIVIEWINVGVLPDAVANHPGRAAEIQADWDVAHPDSPTLPERVAEVFPSGVHLRGSEIYLDGFNAGLLVDVVQNYPARASEVNQKWNVAHPS